VKAHGNRQQELHEALRRILRRTFRRRHVAALGRARKVELNVRLGEYRTR
jgi:hypothetical protein